MDLEQARATLRRAVAADGGAPADDRFRTARQFLIACGVEAAPAGASLVAGLPELIRRAASAPASPARRIFAVLIVDALGVPGLLPAGGSQARLDRAVCGLLENALPDVLLRSGYKFGDNLDAKRCSLAALVGSIDDHLRPPEPTFPAWLSGLPQR